MNETSKCMRCHDKGFEGYYTYVPPMPTWAIWVHTLLVIFTVGGWLVIMLGFFLFFGHLSPALKEYREIKCPACTGEERR